MPEYSYKSNRPQPNLPAQEVGEELERIRHKHDIRNPTPELVVEESRPKDAKLHEVLDLHLSVRERAERWAMHKARNVINVLMIVPENPDGTRGREPVAAYVNITEGPADNPTSRSYVPIEDVLADPAKRAMLVQRCLEKLVRVQREFRHLKELEVVWNAVDQAVTGQVLVP